MSLLNSGVGREWISLVRTEVAPDHSCAGRRYRFLILVLALTGLSELDEPAESGVGTRRSGEGGNLGDGAGLPEDQGSLQPALGDAALGVICGLVQTGAGVIATAFSPSPGCT